MKRGGVVIFPTETVYGIGASAFDINACSRIFQIKNRPVDNPFILHVHSSSVIEKYAYTNEIIRDTIDTFSPGPISYILKKKEEKLFSAGLDTVGLRIPSHPLALQMLALAEIPVAAPSANLSGKPSLTRIEDVILTFDGIVDCILDGGDSEIGIESTVIDLSSDHPLYLRPGKISIEVLQTKIPDMKMYSFTEGEKPKSPGLKYRHYAPECNIYLVEKLPENIDPDTARIGFAIQNQSKFDIKIKDNLEYMHTLYSFFIDCDRNRITNAFCEVPRRDEFHFALVNRIEKAMGK